MFILCFVIFFDFVVFIRYEKNWQEVDDNSLLEGLSVALRTGFITTEFPLVLKEKGFAAQSILNKFEPYGKSLVGMCWNITKGLKVRSSLNFIFWIYFNQFLQIKANWKH